MTKRSPLLDSVVQRLTRDKSVRFKTPAAFGAPWSFQSVVRRLMGADRDGTLVAIWMQKHGVRAERTSDAQNE